MRPSDSGGSNARGAWRVARGAWSSIGNMEYNMLLAHGSSQDMTLQNSLSMAHDVGRMAMTLQRVVALVIPITNPDGGNVA